MAEVELFPSHPTLEIIHKDIEVLPPSSPFPYYRHTLYRKGKKKNKKKNLEKKERFPALTNNKSRTRGV